MHANLTAVLGHPERDPREETAPKPDSSQHPEPCAPVKDEEAEREAGLPDHDVTDATCLHTLEEGDGSLESPSDNHPQVCSFLRY